MFNEAPKFIRQQLQQSDTPAARHPAGHQVGPGRASPAPPPTRRPAITAGRPVTNNSVPTAHRARRLVYAPDLDGRADPGEIVWTWVVYEDDPTRGKDRPVLVVGRDRPTLLGLMLSSQDHHRRRPRLGRHRQRQLGLRGPGELGAVGPGARRARRGHPSRGRDPGARDVRGGRRAAARRVLLELARRPPIAWLRQIGLSWLSPHGPHGRPAVRQLDLADDLEAEPQVVRHQSSACCSPDRPGRCSASQRSGASASAPGRNPRRGPSGRCR